MKKLILYILPLLAVASCSKNLEEHPKAIASENFYNTPSEAEAGLNAIYSALKNNNAMGEIYPAQIETYSDYLFGRGSYEPLNNYSGLDNTNITRAGQIWSQLYRAISNANICIQRIPNGSGLTDDEKIKYEGEARFMRGLTYFMLAKCWGGVILRTENNMDSTNIGRSSLEQTYALALSDLKFSEENLPETPRLPGAGSKWTAKAVLTEFYLWQHDWQNALNEAADIINSGKFSLVPVSVSEDFDKIFGPDVLTTPEEIFYLKYSREGGSYGFRYVAYGHAPGDGHIGGGGGGFYAHYTDTILNNCWEHWDNKDLRKKFNWYPWNIGLGNNTLLPNKFNDPAATSIDNVGNDYPWYKYSDILLYYAEAESRVNNGPDAAAIEALNKVHRRAYGYDASQPSSVDFRLNDYNLQSFIDLVAEERMYEDCYEAKRWLDLVRLGTVKQVIQANKGKTVADKMLLWPIPTIEMDNNKALDPVKDQNPGY